MIRYLIISVIFFFQIAEILAQKEIPASGSAYCSQKKQHRGNTPVNLSRTMSSTPHSFNVLDYKLNLDLYPCYSSPYSHFFEGKNTMKFLVDSTLSSITLNAVNTSLIIDSVGLSGISFIHANDLLTIQLDRIYNPGEIVTIKINYHHKNVNDNAFYAKNGFVFTDSEPEGARKWFPCWDSPSDKATLDLTAKVPASVKLGSNGILADSVRIADTLWYHWISSQNVATYLMVITSKVGYNLDILYWHKISNPNDSIPIRFYYNQGEHPETVENKILDMTDWFSQKFCEHPFDKNGFATLNEEFTWGGMENQTLTSFCQNCWMERLAAHEFAHQWFGDMITCSTWADIWLNEGFASWSEFFWYESYQGYPYYKSGIDAYAADYLYGNQGYPISMPSWATHTPPSDTLFNWAITYAKGACVVHQLRYVLGDVLFFNVLRDYCNDTNLRYRSAVIPDFIQKVNQITGGDYQWFFDEWIYQPNHPVYQNTYNFSDLGNGQWKVNFTINQTQENPSFFKMPVELRISFDDLSDTNLLVMNDYNHQPFSWVFNKKPVLLEFDPDNEIVLRKGTTVVGAEPITGNLSKGYLLQNYPNPVSDKTSIHFEITESIPVKLELVGLLGNRLFVIADEVKAAGKYTYEVDCSSLKSGIYLYKLTAGNETQVRKIIIQ